MGEMLAATLANSYGLEVESVVALKTVYGVVTRDGHRFIWKALGNQTAVLRLLHVIPVLRTLRDAGFSVTEPIPALSGEWVCRTPDGQMGWLQSWYRGRRADYANREERMSALRTMAELHSYTRIRHLGSHLSVSWGLLQKLQNKSQALGEIWPRMKRHFPEAEQMSTIIEENIESAIASLAMQKSWPGDTQPFSFCHRDLAPHNWVFEPTSSQFTLIDFDLCGWDDPLLDILQIVNHAVFQHDLQEGDLREMVRRYSEVAELSTGRRRVLRDLIKFPDVLIRTAMEWAKGDFSPRDHDRIRAALRKEQIRTRIWTADFV